MEVFAIAAVAVKLTTIKLVSRLLAVRILHRLQEGSRYAYPIARW